MELISKIKPFGLRLPRELKQWAETRSIRNSRSLNAEINAILAAVRLGEEHGSGMENFANPSGIPGTVELFPPEENDFRR